MKSIALSIDLEDWFCVQNMKYVFPFKSWNKCELRIQESTTYLLNQLKENNVKATFFILGWIAERMPDIVRDIASNGHEIASHGYSHTLITHMTPCEFQIDVEKSLHILTDIVNKPINGYRAPSFTITRETMWALDILRNCGLKYDSSIYPIKHPDYGISDFQQNIHEIRGILEVPLTTTSIGGMQIPISGGGYFRLFPYWLFKILMMNKSTHDQVITYFHPWEFDASQPKINLPLFKRFRHYVGLSQNRQKFEKFIHDFKFITIADILSDYLAFKDLPSEALTLNQEVAF